MMEYFITESDQLSLQDAVTLVPLVSHEQKTGRNIGGS